MPYYLSPIGNSQIVDANGNPLVGGTIETYLAGTSTAATTYTDDTGGTAQGVVMTLNSLGRPTNGPVWMLGGVALKFIIKNASGVVQAPTFDDVLGIGDASTTPDQFPFATSTPTYISATSFSLVGDKTNEALRNRRIRSVNNGGTIYSTISASSFGAGVTTVTVVNDSGVLDVGLSAVSYGLLTPTNDALPRGIFPTIADMLPSISGLTYSNNVADATNDIDIAAGVAVDSTGVAVLRLASSLTKRLDAAWAVGTNQGGLDTGAIGNSDYYIWLISRSDTGVVDVLFSLSSTAPTMPANYTYKRLIGWFKRVGATIVAFHTYITDGGGIEMNWDAPTLDINLANTLTTSRRTDALKVPLNFSVEALVTVVISDASVNGFAWIGNPDQTDAAPSLTAAPLYNLFWIVTANASSGQTMRIRTSSTGTVAARASLATVDLYAAVTNGFVWARRN